MTKKLTITVSDDVYRGLHRKVGRRKISSLIDRLAQDRGIESLLNLLGQYQ